MAYPLQCRNEATRTPDPYVPNVVRYQLRYIPIAFEKWCHQESNLLFRFIPIPWMTAHSRFIFYESHWISLTPNSLLFFINSTSIIYYSIYHSSFVQKCFEFSMSVNGRRLKASLNFIQQGIFIYSKGWTWVNCNLFKLLPNNAKVKWSRVFYKEKILFITV